MTGSSTGFGWASGKVGTGIGMDGTTGTGIVLPNAFLKGSQGSLSLWMNAQALSDRNVIFTAKSTSDNNIYVAFGLDRDGRPQLQFRDTSSGNDRRAQGTKTLNPNEWYNLTLTASGQTYKIYINGEEVTVAGENLGRWFPDFTNHTLSYRIGMLEASPLSGSFNGYLDDLKIYNRPLTADEAKALYDEGNAMRPTIPAAVAPKVDFTISEDHIPYGGSVAINWKGTNVERCSLASDPTITATSGSKVYVKIAADTSYSITCSSAKYGDANATVKVIVGTSTSSSTTGGTLVVTPATPAPQGGQGAQGKGLAIGKNLSFGSRGDEVHQLQLHLISLGLLPETAATGYFGNLTKAAVVKYQKAKGLPSTGFVGAMTRAALLAGN
jgi:hypothetical protein